MPELGQPGSLPTVGLSAPGRDTVLDRLTQIERFLRHLPVANTANYTTVTSDSPIIGSVAGALGAWVLNLSPTDAAHNDAEIERAIAALGLSGGMIFAPACHQDPTQGALPWPIANRHAFHRADLVGVASGSYIPYGQTVGHGVNGWGTAFICVGADAGFDFNGGPGNVTGGFMVDGAWLSPQPWRRNLNEDSAGDIGRIFQNIYVSRSGPSPTRGTGAGYIMSGDYAPQADAVLTVTAGGTEASTSALHLQTMTAADVQTELEALTNVGAGNVTVTCVETSTSPLQGGPFFFAFTDATAVLTIDDEDHSYHFSPFTALIAGAPYLAESYGIVINGAYLDTFINIGYSAMAGHGLWIDATECNFFGIFNDGSNGHCIGLSQASNCQFILGDLEVPRGSFIYHVGDSGSNTFTNYNLFGIYNTPAAPQIDLGSYFPGTHRFVDLTANSTGSIPVFRVQGELTIDGSCTWSSGNPLAVLVDDNGRVDIKASLPEFIPANDIVLQTSATLGQVGGIFTAGIVAGWPVQLSAVATVDRPVGTWPAGSAIFDTTLVKPIYADGTGGWVDATGAAV